MDLQGDLFLVFPGEKFTNQSSRDLSFTKYTFLFDKVNEDPLKPLTYFLIRKSLLQFFFLLISFDSNYSYYSKQHNKSSMWIRAEIVYSMNIYLWCTQFLARRQGAGGQFPPPPMIFFFFFCLSAQRSVMSMMMIHQPIMIICGKTFEVEKKCVGVPPPPPPSPRSSAVPRLFAPPPPLSNTLAPPLLNSLSVYYIVF